MATIDYGAIVKKNGKIISDIHGGLFQNLTNLKYNDEEIWSEEEEDYIANPDHIDETLVKFISHEEECYGMEFELSMAGGHMALVGDEHFLIGFYKTDFEVAVDKRLIQNYPEKSMYAWFNVDKHVIPYVVEYPCIGKLTISKIDKSSDAEAYIAKFTYNGDKYEVMFGYGVDVNYEYMMEGYFNYYGPRRIFNYEKLNFSGRKIKNYKYRRVLKRMRAWYKAGLE